MKRRVLIGITVVALLVGGGYGLYSHFFLGGAPAPVAPQHTDSGDKLPTQAEFDELAKTDPVRMLNICLTRYQREVTQGLRCTVEKQERVQGYPKHPEMPPVEVVELCVRGDVPNADTNKTAIEVVMKWKSGARSVLGAEIRATRYSEKPEPEGLNGQVLTWRPTARLSKLNGPIPANNGPAKSQSRYCIRDAGVYRSMLRTHEAWKARQDASEFRFEYLGKRIVEKAGNRECHIIKRICPRIEIDAFEVGGTATSDPSVVAVEGFTEVTLYIDAEHWIQVGTELFRSEPDGTRVLVGSYFFRDVQLKPSFAPDTFTTEGMKKPLGN